MVALVFKDAIETGPLDYLAEAMAELKTAQPSKLTLGTPFWCQASDK